MATPNGPALSADNANCHFGDQQRQLTRMTDGQHQLKV